MLNRPRSFLGVFCVTVAKAVALSVFGFAAVLTTANPAIAERSLVFGTYTADKPTVVLRQFRPILDYIAGQLEIRLGEPVTIKIRIAKTYDDGIADLVAGRVDFSRFGPASYVIAKEQNPDIGILAMETVAGKKTFEGVIAVNTDSDIRSIADLRNRSFAFGNELSTIGRYLAQERLVKAGITAGDLSGFEYLGRHDIVGVAVGQGKFDAGALKSSTFEKLRAKGVPIRQLATMTNVTKPWIHSADADPEVVSALRMVLFNLTDPETLKNFTKSGFAPGVDTDFNAVRLAIRHSEEFAR